MVPPGDTETSKRFVDSVASCCQPIFVSPSMLSTWLGINSFLFHVDIAELSAGYIPSHILLIDTVEYLNATLNQTDERGSDGLMNASTVFGLMYAQEDHPVLFDVVDRVVVALVEASAYKPR